MGLNNGSTFERCVAGFLLAKTSCFDYPVHIASLGCSKDVLGCKYFQLVALDGCNVAAPQIKLI